MAISFDRRSFLVSLPAVLAAHRLMAQGGPPQIRVNGLSQLTLTVSDPKRSIEFYQGLFGMPVQARQGTTTYLRIGAGPRFLAIVPAGPGERPSISRFGMGVEQFDVDNILKILAQHGVTPADGANATSASGRTDEGARRDARQHARDVRRRSGRHRVPAARCELLRWQRTPRQHVPAGAGADEGAARGEGHESLHGRLAERPVLSRSVWHAGAGDAGDDARIRRWTGRAFPDVHRGRRRRVAGPRRAAQRRAAQRRAAVRQAEAAARPRRADAAAVRRRLRRSITPAWGWTASSRKRSRKR